MYHILCRWHLQSFGYTRALTKNIQLLKGQRKCLNALNEVFVLMSETQEMKLILLWKITQSLLSFPELRVNAHQTSETLMLGNE